MRTSAPSELPLFRSELQAQLLSALLASPGDALTAAHLGRLTGGSRASVHRELHRLVAAGIIRREDVGRSALYRAATDSPLFEPLQALVARTLGVEPELRRRLARLEGIEAAAVFGSWAAGRAREGSDIDVLVIGDVERADLLRAFADVEDVVRREISVRLYRRAEFEARLDEGSGFLRTVLARPMTPLIGTVPSR